MPEGADVQSIPALREWSAAMTVYREEASNALSGISTEIRRGVDWVGEQGSLWQRAVRQCEEDVVRAKAELAARKFPNWDGKMPDTTVQERNLRRAQARLEHAEEKVRLCRSWLVRLPKQIDELYSAHGHKLQNFLDGEMARGLALLTRQIEALERYAELKTDYAPVISTTTGGAS